MNSKRLQAMDSVLTEMGLVRKQITREDSVFRAVSEKLFYSQCHHETVKARALDYFQTHIEEFQQYCDDNLLTRMDGVRERKYLPFHLEMIALSRYYRLDFIIFHSVSQQQYWLTQNFYGKKIWLCYVEDDHYDLVYTKETIQSAAVCQSIVYELLYKGVFGMDTELEEATLFLEVQKLLPKENTFPNCFLENVISTLGPEKVNTLQRLCGRSSPPLPYRIAKALHPGLYRNVELDIVQEQKREARQVSRESTKGLSPGDKCHVVFEEGDGVPYQAHIQCVNVTEGTVLVYIEKLGAKRTVPAKCVRPLPLSVCGELENLPVAHVNLLPYLKKNRRKKHPSIPVLFQEAPPSPSAGRPARRTSTCRTSTSSGGGAERSGRVGPEVSVSDSSSGAFSVYCVPKSFQPISPAPPQQIAARSPPAVVAPVPQSPTLYAYPGAAVTSGAHAAVLDDRTVSCGPILDHWAAHTYNSVHISCANQAPDTGHRLLQVPSELAQPCCIMSTGPAAPQQGPVYWMPTIMAVPYGGANVGQVNMGWAPQDPYGRDVQLTDFKCSPFNFYPAGIEYYPMSSQGQPELNCLTPGTIMMDSCGNYSISGPPTVAATGMCGDYNMGNTGGYGEVNYSPAVSDVVNKANSISQSESGHSRRCYDNTAGIVKNSDRPESDCYASAVEINNGQLGGQLISGQRPNLVGVKKVSLVPEEEKELKSKDSEEGSEGMDVGSDGDSGCPSECADLSPVSGPDSFTSSELTHSDGGESGLAPDQAASEKPRGKRRYYMYGNHKLVKPIKEIPLRFQILLAETSAAKARCEGQPIYMQHAPPPQQPMHDIVYYHSSDPSQTQLNANASCFIPNQDGGGLDTNMQTAYMSECFPGVGTPFSNSGTSPLTNQPNFTHALQPGSVFVSSMPPVSGSTNAHNCSTLIVYSSHSTQATVGSPPSRTINVPPPPFPPPPNLPPPPLDHHASNPTVCQTSRPVLLSNKSDQQYKSVPYQPHQSKSLGLMNVPPPNHQVPSFNMSSSFHPVVSSSSMPTSTNLASSYTNPTYLSVQPSPSVPAMHHVSSSPHHQPAPSQAAGAYPPPSVVSSNQYMYVYPSPPTGQPATPPHVVYMVNPAYSSAPTYQQQGLLVPLNCPVPVQ